MKDTTTSKQQSMIDKVIDYLSSHAIATSLFSSIYTFFAYSVSEAIPLSKWAVIARDITLIVACLTALVVFMIKLQEFLLNFEKIFKIFKKKKNG